MAIQGYYRSAFFALDFADVLVADKKQVAYAMRKNNNQRANNHTKMTATSTVV